MAVSSSDMTSPNRCQLYTLFNLAEHIKDSGDAETGINNTSILRYLIDYYGEDIFPASFQPSGSEGKTLGFLWPYTPTINTNITVEYATTGIVNSPYQYNNYIRGQAPSLTVSGQFSANTVQEATLLLAIIQFLRAVTKQRFGKSEYLENWWKNWWNNNVGNFLIFLWFLLLIFASTTFFSTHTFFLNFKQILGSLKIFVRILQSN